MKARYHLFGTYEEAIAYDILTAHPEKSTHYGEELTGPIFVNFETANDRKKAVEWLSEALKYFVATKQYWNLSYKEQGEIDKVIFNQLQTSNPERSSRYPIIYEIKNELKTYSFSNDFAGTTSVTSTTKTYYHVQYTVICNDTKVKDKEAIDYLRNRIYPTISRYYPHICSLQPRIPITLMCINKFRKNSLFGMLPRDVAKIIANKVMDNDEMYYRIKRK